MSASGLMKERLAAFIRECAAARDSEVLVNSLHAIMQAEGPIGLIDLAKQLPDAHARYVMTHVTVVRSGDGTLKVELVHDPRDQDLADRREMHRLRVLVGVSHA